ncbi:MAG: tripartite tricarboxylate transporter TctB family protein, partial [Candidatus Marithrix sp.]
MTSYLWLRLLIASIIGFIISAILFAVFNTEGENIWWVWIIVGFSTIFFIWSFVLYLIQRNKCYSSCEEKPKCEERCEEKPKCEERLIQPVIVHHRECPPRHVEVYDQPGDVIVNHKKCPPKHVEVYDQPGDVIVEHRKCPDKHIIKEIPGQTIVEERRHPDQHIVRDVPGQTIVEERRHP